MEQIKEELKDLTFEVSNPSTCLQVLLFLNTDRLFIFANGGGCMGGGWFVDVIIL